MTQDELIKDITYWESKLGIWEIEFENIFTSEKRSKMLKAHINSIKRHIKMLKNELERLAV